jgi:hypothetical protein
LGQDEIGHNGTRRPVEAWICCEHDAKYHQHEWWWYVADRIGHRCKLLIVVFLFLFSLQLLTHASHAS